MIQSMGLAMDLDGTRHFVVQRRLGHGEERNGGQDGDDRNILHQQYGEAGPAGIGASDVALLGRLHGDGRRGHGQSQADDDGDIERKAGSQQRQGNDDGGKGELGDAEAEHLVAHTPDFAGLQIEANEKQHHDDAEFGDLADEVGVGHQPQAIGADQDAGGEIA
nr:hypothetical protein [Devosia ginsengisoli]